jgi:hypothetical protein
MHPTLSGSLELDKKSVNREPTVWWHEFYATFESTRVSCERCLGDANRLAPCAMKLPRAHRCHNLSPGFPLLAEVLSEQGTFSW